MSQTLVENVYNDDGYMNEEELIQKIATKNKEREKKD